MEPQFFFSDVGAFSGVFSRVIDHRRLPQKKTFRRSSQPSRRGRSRIATAVFHFVLSLFITMSSAGGGGGALGAAAAALVSSPGGTGGENNERHEEDLRNFCANPFSAEDEQRELAALSTDQMAAVQSDLCGLSSLLSSSAGGSLLGGFPLFGARPNNTSTDRLSARSPEAIANFNREISELPEGTTTEYYRAVVECPSSVDHLHKFVFLDYQNGDAKKAAQSMAAYWKGRVTVFGPDLAYLPMTLAHAVRDEVMNIATRRIWQVLPVTDAAGRAVLFFSPSRRNFEEHGVQREMRCLWYLLETIIESPDLRQRGVVIVANLQNTDWKHTSGTFAKHYSAFIDEAMPIRLRAVHACHPSALIYYFISPLARRLVPQNVRLRHKLHSGSNEEVLAILQGYCLPRDRLPTEIGGGINIDMCRWTLGRCALEASRHQQQQVSTSSSSMINANSAASAVQTPSRTSGKNTKSKKKKKRRLSDDQEDLIFGLPAPANGTGTGCDAFPNLSDRDIYQRIWHNKTKEGSGRRPDPRMDSAVLACLDDAHLTPVDALCNAGFVFPGVQSDLISRGSKHFVDASGVSLRQRRDQLNRRLRQAREWIKDARAGTLTNNTGNSEENNDENDKESRRVGNKEDDSGDNNGLVEGDQEIPPLPGNQRLDGGASTQHSTQSGDAPVAPEATSNESKRTASEDNTIAANLVAKALMLINQGNEGPGERKDTASERAEV